MTPFVKPFARAICPPVANGPAPTWQEAIGAALKANDGTPKPKSLRALAKALANQAGSPQNEQSWQSTLKRIRRDNRASEPTAARIAAALGVPRSQLPATEKLSVQARVGRLEEQVGQLVQTLAVTVRILESLGAAPALLDEVRFVLAAHEGH